LCGNFDEGESTGTSVNSAEEFDSYNFGVTEEFFEIIFLSIVAEAIDFDFELLVLLGSYYSGYFGWALGLDWALALDYLGRGFFFGLILIGLVFRGLFFGLLGDHFGFLNGLLGFFLGLVFGGFLLDHLLGHSGVEFGGLADYLQLNTTLLGSLFGLFLSLLGLILTALFDFHFLNRGSHFLSSHLSYYFFFGLLTFFIARLLFDLDLLGSGLGNFLLRALLFNFFSHTITVGSLDWLGLDYFLAALFAGLLDHFLLAISFDDWLLGNYFNFFFRIFLF
jgi:hypothetical protein